MTLQQLRYFLAAARLGSFSAAAQALHLSQPTLSDQVKRLEVELGTALFARLGRGVALTEAGLALRPQAEAAIGTVERARASVAEVRELEGGVATFGTFGSAPEYLLPSLAAQFRRRHPNVRLRVLGLNSSEVADAVREGEMEVGLIVLPIDDRGLDVRPVMSDEVLYASAEPSRAAGPVTIERMAQAPLILYDARWGSDDPTRRQLADRAQRAGVRLEPAIEVEHIGPAIELAARGYGDTYVGRAVASAVRFPARLLTAPFADPLFDTFAFVSRRDSPLSAAGRALVAVAEERLAAIERRLAA